MPEYQAGQPAPQNFTLKFGGGLNTRQLPEDIDPREATLLENVDIDIDRKSLRRRMPLIPLCALSGADWEGSAPVTAILGPFPRRQTAGEGGGLDWDQARFLIQSGTDVFQMQRVGSAWKISSSATFTVATGTRLHYTQASFSEADRYGVVTDLNKKEVVKSVYIDTAGAFVVADFAHNLGGTVDLYAKYSFIEDDRLWLANITTDTAGTVANTPHLIVASAREDLVTLSISNRPSSSLGAGDPFYLPTPDLKAVNGVVSALGYLIFSTHKGSMFSLVGFSAVDFYFNRLYSQSGATGDLGVTYAGNDILYYSEGAVESIAGTEAFGNVEVDDFSRPIKKSMALPFNEATTDFTDAGGNDAPEATLAYFSAANTVFVSKKGEPFLWVMNKSFHDQRAKDVSLLKDGTKLSPWCKWTEEPHGSNTGGLLGLYSTTFYSGTSVRQTDKYFYNPIVFCPTAIRVPTDYETFSEDFQVREIQTMLMGGADGVIYYVDPEYDAVNYYQYGLSAYVPDGSGTLEPDVTPYVEACKVKYRSKVIKAPSLRSMKELTALVTYMPRRDVEPELTIAIEFQGRRRKTVTKTVTLENYPLPDSAGGGDTTEDHEEELATFRRSELVSFPCTDATNMQVYLEWDDNLVEIVEIDFNVEA